ncbi:Thiol:disulfide interchange protein TlpA [Novipirellula aureliae]|uniref:Thiol:disulfide interchange protein TlpA n=1 Tax=Novipirellula aureliae TaxID=2527966 RepID=A0A5C6E1D0_9BACT|nr:TlpA disulfide reductase family protein [Novipirellula aureliae]TWU41176.1 Thiol:disulfide interchange protein TlpA [Novipirellula aureliae]
MTSKKDLATPSSDRSTGKSPSNERPLGWIWLLPVLVILGIMLFGRNQGLDDSAIGKPAPKIELIRLSTSPTIEMSNGGSMDISNRELDQLPSDCVALVHFWGTWCGPCRMEYPHLSEMVESLGSNPKFQFLSISCESGSHETFSGLAEKTEDYLNQIGASTHVYADPNGATRKSAADRLGQPAMAYPTTILVDESGIIREVWQGYGANAVHEMEVCVKELLGG